MKRRGSVPVSIAAALFCRALSWFPVWMLVCGLYQPEQPYLAHITALLTLCGTISGFLICGVRTKHGKRHPLSIGISAVLCAAAGYAVYLLTNASVPAFMLPLTVLFPAVTAFNLDADQLFSPTRFGAMNIGAILTVGLLFTASLHVPLTETSAVCAITAVCFLLLRNHSMLHRMVNRRASTETAVPREIRQSNLRMVIVLLVLLTAVFFLRGAIMQLLQWGGSAVGTVLSVGFSAVRKFFEWISSGNSSPADPAEAGDGGGMQAAAEGDHWLINLLIIIPTLLIAVYVWKQFLSDWISDLRDAIIALILRLRAKRKGSNTHSSEDGAYTDTESAAAPESPRKRRMRQWMKELRAWRRLPDNPKKFYAGYRLLLEAPAWSPTPSAADTARELCAKWHIQMPTKPPLDAPTAALEQDRYALKGLPASAYSDIAEALTNISRKR